MTTTFKGIARFLHNLSSLARIITLVDIQIQGESIKLVHPSGSFVTLREDGNIDFLAYRNLFYRGQAILNNCTEEFDALSPEEMMEQARHNAEELARESAAISLPAGRWGSYNDGEDFELFGIHFTGAKNQPLV